ncbi:ABC transporter permease [Stappia sp. ES.058]|uniref:ABC transporter permease n=1 Tax=Stappia sp. ES.058 TaxID=1881061 RepID=UPI00087D321B|nr:ABC transporter permease [Stappia sp. ES.058]SDU43283.1 peptide/nickel transport system permease protein [Stappia sp. ES.058]
MPSAKFFLRRLVYAAISLAILALTVLAFSKVGGDPVAMMLEPGASQADIDALRERLGLDLPLWEQYIKFIKGAVTGDLGTSIYYGQSAVGLYFERLPASLLLAGTAFAWSVLLGIGIGVTAAARPGGFLDRAGSVLALIGMSMPAFWLGMLLIMFFSVHLRWLPSSGSGTWQHLVMPAISLGWYFAASHLRLTRSAMLESLQSDYVRLARLKGMPEWRVILRHALPGALIPVVTLAAINFVLMVNAAVVIETIYAWPGIGRLLYEAISLRDIPVIQAVVLMSGSMIVILNLATDLLYVAIDPRIRHAE